jgi:hypothetical protein
MCVCHGPSHIPNLSQIMWTTFFVALHCAPWGDHTLEYFFHWIWTSVLIVSDLWCSLQGEQLLWDVDLPAARWILLMCSLQRIYMVLHMIIIRGSQCMRHTTSNPAWWGDADSTRQEILDSLYMLCAAWWIVSLHLPYLLFSIHSEL